MNDQVSPAVGLLPGEVVMVLDAPKDVRTKQVRHEPVNHFVVRGRVFTHQVHRGPVLLACLAVEVEPGEPREVAVPVR